MISLNQGFRTIGKPLMEKLRSGMPLQQAAAEVRAHETAHDNPIVEAIGRTLRGGAANAVRTGLPTGGQMPVPTPFSPGPGGPSFPGPSGPGPTFPGPGPTFPGPGPTFPGPGGPGGPVPGGPPSQGGGIGVPDWLKTLLGNAGDALGNAAQWAGNNTDLLAIAAMAAGGYLQGQSMEKISERETAESKRQFDLSHGLNAGQQANALNRQVETNPMRDQVMFLLQQRMGMPQQSFQARDIFNPSTSATVPQSGGIDPTAMANAQASYRPGMGGTNPAVAEALMQRFFGQATGGASVPTPTPPAGGGPLPPPIPGDDQDRRNRPPIPQPGTLPPRAGPTPTEPKPPWYQPPGGAPAASPRAKTIEEEIRRRFGPMVGMVAGRYA